MSAEAFSNPDRPESTDGEGNTDANAAALHAAENADVEKLKDLVGPTTDEPSKKVRGRASKSQDDNDDDEDEALEEPSALAAQAMKNKKSAIKRGHINAAWDSVIDLRAWLKDAHRWSKIKLESLVGVCAERISLKPLGPTSGEIPSAPLTEEAGLASLREEARRYLRARISRLQEAERLRQMTRDELLTQLYQAAGENEVDAMKFCVSQGVPVNEVPPDCSDTSLHYAAYWGKLKAVEYLVSLPEIDLFKKDGAGDTALEVARHFGHAEVCQLLCSKMGLRPSKQDHREAKKKYPGPWHGGEMISGPSKFKGVKINLTDARKESLRRYWDSLESKRPQGIRGTPSTLEQLQLTAFAERVKDWFDKLEEGERAFVHQLKQKGAAKWPKHFARLDLI